MDSTKSPSLLKPIFLVTHTRAISTAFERIFLTREKDIECVHEPFSDAYHWGPEKLTERYANVEELREEKGLQHYDYHAAFDLVDEAKATGKRVFVKDMGKCLFPLHGSIPYIAPSLRSHNMDTKVPRSFGSPRHSGGNVINPTVVPPEYLARFHFTFLIRNPQRAIPSLYECSIPPRSYMTGWHGFKAEDAGYRDIRKLVDYLIRIGQIGPGTKNEICLIDADDLLAYPRETLQKFCTAVNVPFDAGSLHWGTEKDHVRAEAAFKNWAPFHDVVLQSTGLKARKMEVTTAEADMAKWTTKYGKEAAELIQKNVDDNMEHYLYLKKFATRPNGLRN